nr:MAG TPA: hypothetical protein [Caudoviricetes sp.]
MTLCIDLCKHLTSIYEVITSKILSVAKDFERSEEI